MLHFSAVLVPFPATLVCSGPESADESVERASKRSKNTYKSRENSHTARCPDAFWNISLPFDWSELICWEKKKICQKSTKRAAEASRKSRSDHVGTPVWSTFGSGGTKKENKLCRASTKPNETSLLKRRRLFILLLIRTNDSSSFCSKAHFARAQSSSASISPRRSRARACVCV